MVLVTLLSLFYIPVDGIQPPMIPHLDKIVHFIFYFGAVFFGALFVRERTNGLVNMKKVLVLMVFASIIYGIIIEVLQETLTTFRDGNVYDVLANSAGAVFGAISIWYVFSLWSKFSWKS